MSEAFIEAEMALFEAQAAEVDIVITTALIPGRPAPKLWQARAVERMKPGSVVVDLAAEQGGNCELCVPGEIVVRHGVTIMGLTDLPSRMATVTSNLYGTNLTHLLDRHGPRGRLSVNLDDEVIRQSIVLHDGELMWPPPRHEPEVEPAKDPAPEPSVAHPAPQLTGPAVASKVTALTKPGFGKSALIGLALAALWIGLRLLLPRRRDHPAARVPAAPHGVRARLLRRLAGRLERHPRAAHPADGGHQRHQRHHHRRWALARNVDRPATPRCCSARSRCCSRRSTSRVASSSPSACSRCSGSRGLTWSCPLIVAYLVAERAVHPEPARPLQPGDRSARQRLRHHRHGDRGRRDVPDDGSHHAVAVLVPAALAIGAASGPSWPPASR
jgi:hypothetical protein